MALVELKSVWRSFGREPQAVHALREVDLAIEAGEMVVVRGRSGSGKTTLLNLLSGLDSPTRGTISVGGRDLSKLGDRALSRYRNTTVGYVFQAFHLETLRTVLANVTTPLLFTSLGGAATRARGLAALERVGLADKAKLPASTLSAGQRQRVALARALINEPAILLADEPTANLDAATADQIHAQILELARTHGKTVIWVSHDKDLSIPGCRTLQVEDGRVAELATSGAH